ncbi:MAG: hypothetical protein II978_07585 [Clostridia bacterium]|nr:hypothetical protein [Clostridia bacterium]
MRTEIGSEFWNVPQAEENNLFPRDVKWFLSGRSALYAIIRENHFKTVAMPDWCCESMIKPFADNDIEILFYPAMQDVGDISADALFIMDYFGYTGHSGRGNFKGTVIRDVTHSLFSAAYDDADYYFGSLRKWAGFWTGGYAWGFKKSVEYSGCSSDYAFLRKKAMCNKELYISEKSDSKDYLQQYEEAEEFLERVAVFPAAERDIELAGKIDVDFIRKQRKKNAQILTEAFPDITLFSTIKGTDCPMFVPICVEKRDDLRRYLIQNEIYCPVHWPVSKFHKITKDSEKLYNHGLSLVCDQRYTEEDMLRIVSTIKNFFCKGE